MTIEVYNAIVALVEKAYLDSDRTLEGFLGLAREASKGYETNNLLDVIFDDRGGFTREDYQKGAESRDLILVTILGLDPKLSWVGVIDYSWEHQLLNAYCEKYGIEF